MARIEKRPEAKLDLYEIWEYVALKSPARAERIIERIDEVFALLAQNPRMGREQYHLAPNVRSFSVRPYPYIVFYVPLPDREGVEIVRVLHERQDRKREFGEHE